uniref:NADH-ubiquinone oxidoreductase chain 3 n=1 Tax=Syrbatus sp. 2 RRMO-2024a TaxID=3154168 RepID=A0AAU7LKQ7_9COLE
MMLMLIIFFLMIFIMIVMMTYLFYSLSWKSLMDNEKSSPFECGYEPKNSSRIPFSINFYIMALIFLIFDIEFSLMIPLIYININMMNFLIISLFIFFMLTLSMLYEWKQKTLNWLK